MVKFVFSDQPKITTHHIRQINLALPTFSNLPYTSETFIQPIFSANINGTPLSLDGGTKPFAASKQTSVDIDIKKLNIANYVPYLPNPTKAQLVSCLLDIKGHLIFEDSLTPHGTKQLSYTGQIIFSDITLSNDQGTPFLQIPNIAVTTVKTNLFSQKIHISSLDITAPKLSITRTAEGHLHPLDLLAPAEHDQPTQSTVPEKDQGSPFLLDIDNFSLREAAIDFTDESAGNFETLISPFTLHAKNISTAKGKKADYDFVLKTESTETIRSTGTVQITPFAADGSITFDNLKLPKYMPYATPFTTAKATTGSLDFSSRYRLSKIPQINPEIALEGLAITLRELSVKDADKPVLILPELQLSGGTADLSPKTLTLEKLFCNQPTLTVTRNQDNTFNLATLFKNSQPDSSTHSPASQEMPSNEEPSPWVVSVGETIISGYDITLIDKQLAKPASLQSNGTIKLSGFSTSGPPSPIEFTSEFNKSGILKGQGTIGLSPFSLELATTLDQLTLAPFQPYIDQHLNTVVKSGSFSLKGLFSLHQNPKKTEYTYTGQSSINNFSLNDSQTREDLLSWEELTLDKITATSTPPRVSIDAISLRYPYVRFAISDKGVINLTRLIKKSLTKQQTKTATQEKDNASTTPDIAIKRFALRDGKINFIDNKIAPAYATSISTIDGTITGLSSNKEERAEVNFTGKQNQFSLLQITGGINPLSDDIFADLTIDFHDIDLSPASPYTGKHLGYKTDKGKLTLDLHYLIHDRKIEANNHIFLDQFTLGDSVDSPDAISSPIHLALALLRNRAGEITLNIPVQGDLDDPEFSVSGVLLKVLTNLIAKAVTSPFALLGALIPDGKNLQFVPFEPGLANIPADHFATLAQIAKILYERPGLRMDIIGKVDPEKDRNAIEEVRFRKLLKKQKAKDQQELFNKHEFLDLKSITISEAELPRYLTMAYKEMLAKRDTRPEGAKRWSRFSSFVQGESPEKGLSIEKMKAHISSEIQVSDAELRLLAHKRAANVKQHLIESGKIEAERLFVLEPTIASEKGGDENPGANSDAVAMRVDLVIK